MKSSKQRVCEERGSMDKPTGDKARRQGLFEGDCVEIALHLILSELSPERGSDSHESQGGGRMLPGPAVITALSHLAGLDLWTTAKVLLVLGVQTPLRMGLPKHQPLNPPFHLGAKASTPPPSTPVEAFSSHALRECLPFGECDAEPMPSGLSKVIYPR